MQPLRPQRAPSLNRLAMAMILVTGYGCATPGTAPMTPNSNGETDYLTTLPPSTNAAPAMAPAAPQTPAAPVGVAATPPAPSAPPVAAKPAAASPEKAAAEEELPLQSTVIKGNDTTVKLPQPRKVGVVAQGAGVTLQFEQAPVTEVVNAILGDMLKLDYTIQQPLTGDITLHTHAPIPRDQVLGLLDSLLSANGLAMSRDNAGVYHVGKTDSLKPMTGSGLGRPGALPPGYGTVIIPLKYIGVGEMAEILKPLAPAEAFLRVDTLRNMLIMVGSRTQMDAWMEIIDTFDVDFLSGMSVGVFPLEHAAVKDVVDTMQAVLANATDATSATASRPAAVARTNPASAAQQTGRVPGSAPAAGDTQITSAAVPSSLAGLVKVLPIERLNSIIVVTPRAEMLEKVKNWIERIDRASINDAGNQLWVYKVINGSASHLATLLGNLYGSNASAGTPATRTTDSGASTFGNNSLNKGTLFGSSGSSSGSSLGGSSGGSGGITQPTTQQVTIGNVKVVADGATNSLLVYGTRKEYKGLETALKRLDVMPSQVSLEANIVEVKLTESMQYGVQWYFNNGLKNGWTGNGFLTNSAPSISSIGGSLATVGGAGTFNYVINNQFGDVRAILNAIAAQSNLNVISSPNVMVMDNQTATMSVGTQQPIVTGTNTYPTGGGILPTTQVSETIQYKDTGLVLNVTPTVNAGGLVTMVINQQIINIGNLVDTGQTKNYAFEQRQISTKVAVRDGATIVLGGLIRDSDTTGNNGIPYLSRIPVLGALFGQQSKSSERTELLLLITPKVMRNDEELRSTTEEMKARVTGLADSFRRLSASKAGKGAKSEDPNAWGLEGEEEPIPAPQTPTPTNVLKPRASLPENRKH